MSFLVEYLIKKKKGGDCEKKGLCVSPEGIHGVKAIPRRGTKIKEGGEEGFSFSKEALQEEIPGEKRAVLKKDAG